MQHRLTHDNTHVRRSCPCPCAYAGCIPIAQMGAQVQHRVLWLGQRHVHSQPEAQVARYALELAPLASPESASRRFSGIRISWILRNPHLVDSSGSASRRASGFRFREERTLGSRSVRHRWASLLAITNRTDEAIEVPHPTPHPSPNPSPLTPHPSPLTPHPPHQGALRLWECRECQRMALRAGRSSAAAVSASTIALSSITATIRQATTHCGECGECEECGGPFPRLCHHCREWLAAGCTGRSAKADS